MLNSTLSFLAPYLPDLLNWLIGGLLGWLALRFTKVTGIQIEAKDREALQSALRNGALLALSRAGSGDGTAGLVQAYVESSVPDALRRLAPKPEVLDGLIRAHLTGAKQAATVAVLTR